MHTRYHFQCHGLQDVTRANRPAVLAAATADESCVQTPERPGQGSHVYFRLHPLGPAFSSDWTSCALHMIVHVHSTNMRFA